MNPLYLILILATIITIVGVYILSKQKKLH